MKKFDIYIDVLLLILAALNFIGGLYIGIRYMFVGGIIDVVTSYKMDSPDAWLIAWGVAKIFFTSLPISIGYLIALFLCMVVISKKIY